MQKEDAITRCGTRPLSYFRLLADEVLERQSKTARLFLLQTSVPERFTAELAEALTGRKDSTQWLAKLIHTNLFITATGTDEVWYQYHPLFAEFLRRRLTERPASGTGTTSPRHAVGFAGHGLLSEAIAHAIRASDFVKAGEWIEQACDAAMQYGQLATMRQWLDALPPTVVENHPGLNIWYGWVVALQNDFDAIELYLRQAEIQARRFRQTEPCWKPEVEKISWQNCGN